LLLMQPTLLAFLLPALPPPDSLFLPMRRPLLLSPLRDAGGRPSLGHGSDRAASTVTLC
jgi:hypothetical protein